MSSSRRRPPAQSPRNSARYKRLCEEFKARQGRWGKCGICGGEVDMAADGRSLDGPTIDHVMAPTMGGSWLDLSNWQLAHNRCNRAKGQGPVSDPRPLPPLGQSRDAFCWIKGLDGWMHVLPLHGEPDHWNCEWPGCRHGEAADL